LDFRFDCDFVSAASMLQAEISGRRLLNAKNGYSFNRLESKFLVRKTPMSSAWNWELFYFITTTFTHKGYIGRFHFLRRCQ
jgi:hypothetical protein